MRSREEIRLEAARRYDEAREFWANWKTEAADDYAFIAGKQWEDADEAILREQKRPPVTFNYSEKMVDAVVGAEVSNRQEVNYKPRGVEDAGVADLWNAAAKYVRDGCDAEDEESDAFRDMLICGLGWTRTRLDYDEDPDGKISVDRIDPLEMLADPAASKKGLTDRRYHFRDYWVDKGEVKQHFPQAPVDDGAATTRDDTSRGVITRGNRYNDHDDDQRSRKDQVKIRFYEWFEFEPLYRVQGPDGNLVDMDQATFTANKQANESQGLQFVKQRRKVYFYAWLIGETLLKMDKSPCQEGWCINAITGKRDRNKNTWYGLTRVMKDPQRWANKWLSQIMHIINSNAKGGLLAEVGAFVDPSRAQEEWAKPDSVTLLNEGGLKKVQEKEISPYPSGLDKLMEFALGSLPMVTGINLEALGLANREQAGVLEQQRKQAAYGLLSPMFDAMRHYRKSQGRVLLSFIRNFISDGRLIRIGGPADEQYVPLTKDKDAAKYDIVVDDAPNAPDVKDRTWEALGQILPAALKAGMPIPPDVLDYTPIPASLAMKWKQFIVQQGQQQQEADQQMQQLAQENQQLKMDKSAEMMTLQQKQQAQEAEFALKRQAQQEEIQLERERAVAEFQLEQLKFQHQQQLEERRLSHEQNMRKQSVDNEFKVKAFSAGMKASGEEGGDQPGQFQIGLDASPISDAMSQIAQSHQESNQVVAQALQTLAQAISRPRKLVTNAAGQPIGSAPADNL